VFPLQRLLMRTIPAIVVPALLLANLAAPAQSVGDAGPTPTLKVNTRLTLVDVTVTDSKGRPVHGLTQADFTVTEDGKPQPIKNFEEHRGETPTQALPPNIYTNRQTPNAPSVNILLLDQVATGISRGLQPNLEALKYAKEAALKYLGSLPAVTQVAVMAMDEGGLHLLQGVTSDQKLLLAAVNSVAFQIVPESRWDPPSPPERPNILLLCNAMNFQSARALNALNQIALFVSGIPGRKNLIWFTPGTAWLTHYVPFSQLECLNDFTPQLQQVYGRLSAARAAIYPIDPRGLFNDQAFSASTPGRTGMTTPGFSSRQDTESLEDMARATGGKAHYSNNDLAGALQEDSTTGADYYALSYVPPLSKYDGKYHTIEVSVDRPGVQLEYRRGYTSLDLEGPILDAQKTHGKPVPQKGSFQTAMGYGAPAATQVVFAVRALPAATPVKRDASPVIGSLNPELKGKPLVRYSFAFDLPRDKITLAAQPDGSRKASFELAIAAYDVQGRVLNSLDEKRTVTLKPDAVAGFLQKPFVVPVEIDLPPGALSIRTGVLDLPSQEMGIVEIPLTVTK
jgi:VWFA-related protein